MFNVVLSVVTVNQPDCRNTGVLVGVFTCGAEINAPVAALAL